MKATELLVSGLNITEDDYSYKGLFILSGSHKTMNVDISELEDEEKLSEIKALFELNESNSEIRSIIMEYVIEKASISSKFNEGLSYGEDTNRKKTEKAARSLDIS